MPQRGNFRARRGDFGRIDQRFAAFSGEKLDNKRADVQEDTELEPWYLLFQIKDAKAPRDAGSSSAFEAR
jgi:hypothetical protein